MPKKPRKGKAFYSKKKKIKQHPPAPVVQQQAISQIPKPDVAPPAASTPSTKPTSKTAQYPYVIAELKSIGIISGIILVILIVLALVLS
jgi:hypothetical protein